jgi:hypothetical protein
LLGIEEIFLEILEAKGGKMLALEYIVKANIQEWCHPT